jgi:hypothetical protein
MSFTMKTVATVAKAISALDAELNINRTAYNPKDGSTPTQGRINFLDGQKERLESIKAAFDILCQE